VKTRVQLAAIGAATVAIACSGVFGQITPAPRTFKPPRIAVVDVAEVFEGYAKKKDREAQLEVELKAEEKKHLTMMSEYKASIEELKNVEDGSEKHKELTLKKANFEYEIKAREKELMKEFEEKHFKFVAEMRGEILKDLETYAASMDIDMVIEKKVVTPGKTPRQGSQWPIVHYAKPELDITQDLIKRLNAQYKPLPSLQPAPGGTATGPTKTIGPTKK